MVTEQVLLDARDAQKEAEFIPAVASPLIMWTRHGDQMHSSLLTSKDKSGYGAICNQDQVSEAVSNSRWVVLPFIQSPLPPHTHPLRKVSFTYDTAHIVPI